MSDASSRRRARIARRERVRVGDLDLARRAELTPQLFELFRESSEGVSLERFEKSFLPTDDTTLGLFYGDDGALVGCAAATLRTLILVGRPHGVFNGSAYFRADTSGGSATSWFGLGEALRAKTRAPGTPLSIITRARTAATYRLAASTAERVYPSRKRTTPPEIEALAIEIARQCGYETDPRNPWLVSGFAETRDPERLARSTSLRADPEARFYEELTREKRPDQTLMIWVPLDLRNIRVSAVNLSARAIAKRWQRR